MPGEKEKFFLLNSSSKFKVISVLKRQLHCRANSCIDQHELFALGNCASYDSDHRPNLSCHLHCLTVPVGSSETNLSVASFSKKLWLQDSDSQWLQEQPGIFKKNKIKQEEKEGKRYFSTKSCFPSGSISTGMLTTHTFNRMLCLT